VRISLVVVMVAVAAGCGSPPKVAPPPEPPPRILGPEELGPVPPELRHVETDAYTADVEAPAQGTVKAPLTARIQIKAKPGLWVVPDDQWKLEVKAPQDVDVNAPVVANLTPGAPTGNKDAIVYEVTIVPLRAGVRHVTFKLDGSVCDNNFCDVVGDLMSWNVEVR
jgi:hypothetical protein